MAEMARLLAKLTTDETMLRTMGAAAYESAKGYSIDSHYQQFITILDQIMRRAPQLDPVKRSVIAASSHPLSRQRQLFIQAQPAQPQIIRVRKGKIKRFRDKLRRRLRWEKIWNRLGDRRAGVADLAGLDAVAD
jgi:hypothetical protein